MTRRPTRSRRPTEATASPAWFRNYRVAETDPSGYVSLADADGGNPNIIDVAGLQPNQNVAARDFEDTQPNRYLGDRIWLDLDGDGMQDGGEPGISNVTVVIYLPARTASWALPTMCWWLRYDGRLGRVQV